MIKNDQSGEPVNSWHPCGAMHAGKGCRIFCGIFMIVIGIFWFGKLAGWFTPEVIAMFWQAILVMLGVGMIGTAVMGRRNHS